MEKIASLAPVEFVITDKESGEIVNRLTIDPNVFDTLIKLIHHIIIEYDFDPDRQNLYKLNLM